MKNTGIVYPSTEKTPVILPEMEELLPPLSNEQLSMLETDILANGCYCPVIVNEDMVIIDGHHRQKICAKHDIPYQLLVFSFADKLEAKQWALDTQKNRRNLTAWELGNIALKLKPDLEAKAKENLSQGAQNAHSQEPLAISPKAVVPINTREAMAKSVGIGSNTMGKVMQIDEHAPEVVKEALDNKELSVNQGYNITKEVQKLPEEEREAAAMEAIQKLDAEVDRRTRTANIFCKAYERAVLLTPTEENVRIWVEGTRMTPAEMESTVEDSLELAGKFTAIAEIIRTKILPSDWRCACEDS